MRFAIPLADDGKVVFKPRQVGGNLHHVRFGGDLGIRQQVFGIGAHFQRVLIGSYQDSLKMSTNTEDLLAYPQIAAEPDMVQISTDLARLENDFAVIRQRYREAHPKYILAASSLAGLKGQLAANALKARARIQESLRIAY